MRRAKHKMVATLIFLALAGSVRSQDVIDRIVAKVDTDIILLSDIRELQRYQQFVDGKSEADQEALDRLIDQWIVRNEAKAALFSQPKDEDV